MALTLKQAFESTFHEKQSFTDFLQADAASSSKLLHLQTDNRIARAYYQPDTNLKSYARFLNQFVFSHADIVNDVVFSYRKDTSILQALTKHTGNCCFFKTDFLQFFQSIAAADVETVIHQRLTASPIFDLQEYNTHIKNMVLIEAHLPVGLPTSPVISNAVLYDFDLFFQQWSEANQVTYTRYSDDLIFSATTDEAIKRLPNLLSDWLSNHYEGRFKLNPRKTTYAFWTEGKTIRIGIASQWTYYVTRQLKDKIEVLLHYYLVDKQLF